MSTEVAEPVCPYTQDCRAAIHELIRWQDGWLGAGLIAGGADAYALAIWELTEEGRWAPRSLPFIPTAQGIEAASNGSAIVVFSPVFVEPEGTALMHVSLDGVTWSTRKPLDANIYDVFGDEAGFVAVGRRMQWVESELDYLMTPVVATSVDGRTWTEATEVPETLGMLEAIQRTQDGRYIGVGTATDGSVIAWTSTDGSVWSETNLAPPGTTTPSQGFKAHHVGVAETGIVVMVNLEVGALAWASADGLAWTTVDPPLTAAGNVAYVLGVGGGSNTVIAFGSTQFWPVVDPAPLENVIWTIAPGGG
jgi:hypothetical protein